MHITDYGPNALVTDIVKAAINNNNFRTAFWTGEYLQLTLMTLRVGEDIGLEAHPHTDQFLFVAEGAGVSQIGESKDKLVQYPLFCENVVFVPAGKYHNIINTGNRPLRLISIYGPPNHARGTVHRTRAFAEAEEYQY